MLYVCPVWSLISYCLYKYYIVQDVCTGGNWNCTVEGEDCHLEKGGGGNSVDFGVEFVWHRSLQFKRGREGLEMEGNHPPPPHRG